MQPSRTLLKLQTIALIVWIMGRSLLIAGPIGLSPAGDQTAADLSLSTTVAFIIDHNRMIVEVEFARPDGTIRKARAWVDTGSQFLTLSEPLARDLGFDVSGLKEGKQSVELNASAPPMRLGKLPLRVDDGVRLNARSGALVWPGIPAEATIPASSLRHYDVVFDYPARLLTIARSGVLKPRGAGIKCLVNSETGLFMIAAVVDGDTVQFGVDNGSAGTWISNTLTTRWSERHPDWPRKTGAVGSTNFFGLPFETGGILMQLPEIRIAELTVRNSAVLGLDQSLFDWYSQKSAGKVLGFIGANVLKNFRLEIDFPNRMTYWEKGPVTEPNDLDIIGLTLRPEADGNFTVAGVVKTGGQPTVEGIQPGDKLIRIGEMDIKNATMDAVVNALRGEPGATRNIIVERDGKRLTVKAKVQRLP
ncbi:MAG: PDZ domain-containing protein [Candidatus Neomarinimicrobiota bacterium]